MRPRYVAGELPRRSAAQVLGEDARTPGAVRGSGERVQSLAAGRHGVA